MGEEKKFFGRIKRKKKFKEDNRREREDSKMKKIKGRKSR